MYRPVVTNPEYFVNWVSKFDLLCLPQAYIGFFASSFFIGVIIAIYFVPRYSDANGRLTLIVGSITLQMLAQLGMIASDNILFVYFCMFCLGLTFPGKNIIFYNYVMEIMESRMRENIVNLIATLECSCIIFGTYYYQHISNDWLYIQAFCTSLTVCALTFIIFFFPESPKFLYSKGRYNEARASLRSLARFNGVNSHDHFEFIFDTEIRNKDPLNYSRNYAVPISNAANEQNSSIDFEDRQETASIKADEDPDLKKQHNATYKQNLVKMTIMWSAASFSNYLLNFLNKYLEGSIFDNNYYEGVANILSILIGASVYARLGKRKSFIIAYALCILGGVCIFCLETGSVTIPEFYLA